MGAAPSKDVSVGRLALSRDDVVVNVESEGGQSDRERAYPAFGRYTVGEKLILKEETKSSRSDDMNPAHGGVLKETKSNGGVLLFSDFRRQANDLLTKDYYNKDIDMDKNLRARSNAGVDLTLTTLSSINGFSMGDITASYKSKNDSINFKIINAVTDKSNNGFSTSTQVQYELVPDMMNVFMSMEYPDMNRGDGSKVGFQFISLDNYSSFTTTCTLGLLGDEPILESSATIGNSNFALGLGVVSDYTKYGINYIGGIRLTNSIFDVSTLVSDDKTMRVSCVHLLNLKNRSCVVAELHKMILTDEAPTTLTVGTSFEVNHPWKEEMKTVVKAKIDNHGNMGVVLQQQLIENKILQICSEFDTNMAFNKTPRIGVSLCFLGS